MTINRSAILCAKFGQGPYAPITQLINKFSDNVSLELSMLLLYHKNIEKKSFFQPYINSLPKFYSVPSYWDFEIFEYFQDSPTLKRAIGNLKSRYLIYAVLIIIYFLS